MALQMRTEDRLGLFRPAYRRNRKSAARINDETLAFHSPSIDKFVTGWNVAPTINGEPILTAVSMIGSE
jgi:hypothetical protein